MKSIQRRVLLGLTATCMAFGFGVASAQTNNYGTIFPGIRMDKNIASSGQEVKPVKKDKRPIRVGWIPSALDSYTTLVLAGAKEQVDKLGGKETIDLLVQAPNSNSSVDDTIRIVEGWINDRVDAIAVTIYNEGAMLPTFKRATEAGIPIFAFCSPIVNNPYYVSDVGYDQADGGRAQAQWLVNTYGDKKIKVAVLEGLPGPHTSSRMNGFNEIISKHPNIQIVARQPANWVRAKGLSVTEDILTAHPDIDVLMALFDEMALGGLQALKEKRLNGKVAILGYENLKEANAAILTGDFAATVDTGAKEVGRNVIRAINEFVIKGQPVPKKIFLTPKVYDAKNIKSFDQSEYGYVPQKKQ